VEAAAGAFAADVLRSELALEGEYLAIGGRGGFEPRIRQFLIARAVEPAELDCEPRQLIQLRALKPAQVP
jgi:hypothetical protein